MRHSGLGRSGTRGLAARAFTLVELLVVVGILALLVAILLPSLNAARRNARTLQCASNIRSIGTALAIYASENRGRFPPNLASKSPGQYWYDLDRAGKYLPNQIVYGSFGVGGAALVCPEDPEAKRSYAMNIWASSKIDDAILSAKPPRGIPWDARAKQSTRMILVAERWSHQGSRALGWFAPAFLGAAGTTPGQRFGAKGGLVPATFAGRWGMVNSELPYVRHRISNSGAPTAPQGRVNLGYADGHVALKAFEELADPETGLSRLDSLWSALDPAINQ